MAMNMLPSPRPVCFPLYSIRSQQEANSTSFFPPARPTIVYIHISVQVYAAIGVGVASAGAREYA